MKNILLILILFYSCSKPVIIIRGSVGNNAYTAKGVNLNSDTTVNGIWDLGWKVLRIENAIIHGTGTITNFIIAASAWQQIFDSSINIGNIKIYDGAFSAMWWGANPANADNWWNIQKSINLCINNFPLYIPKGNYNYSKSLTASAIYKGNYVATKLDMYGDGDLWSDATTLTCTGQVWFGFGIQYAKGGSIHNIKFQGQFVSPTNNGIPYYTLTDAQFKDQSGNTIGRNYTGLMIDWDSNLNSGGSTGLKVYDVWVDGFDILYNISPNGVTYNADILSFKDIRCGNGRIGFLSGQAQEKGNTITNIVSWANLHTLIDIGNSGKLQAGSYTITGGNIAGSCIRLFNVRLSGWNSFAVQGLTSEGIATIGTVTTGNSTVTPVALLNDLRVRFALPSQAGSQVLLTANSYNIKVSNSSLWYYGLPTEVLHFSGMATMDNNSYSGAVKWN